MMDETKRLAIEQLERVSKNLGAIGETVDYTELAIEALEQYDDMEKTIMSNGQLIETLHDIQKMIASAEENNVCTYYNTTCCGALLSSIETVIEETLIELGESK